MLTLLFVLFLVTNAFAGGSFDRPGGGGGGAPATTPGLNEVVTEDDEVTIAVDADTAVKIGDGTDNVRIFTDATFGPIIRPYLNGTPATWDEFIEDGESRDTVIENGGDNDVCVSIDATGLTTYDHTVESCGTIAGNMTFSGTVTHSSTVTESGVVTNTGGRKKTPTFGTADTYTMLDSDCGTTIGNADADALEVDLIAVPTGCVVCFYAETAQTITADPNSTDAIIMSGLTP
jgi:hypothetical protein